MRTGRIATAAALLVAGTTVAAGGARLSIALEDRLDRNPRQVALGVEMAGVALGLAISWSKRPAAFR